MARLSGLLWASTLILDPQIAAKIEALEPAVVKEMRETLLAAEKRADADFTVVCTENLKSGHSGGEVRPEWLVNE